MLIPIQLLLSSLTPCEELLGCVFVSSSGIMICHVLIESANGLLANGEALVERVAQHYGGIGVNFDYLLLRMHLVSRSSLRVAIALLIVQFQTWQHKRLDTTETWLVKIERTINNMPVDQQEELGALLFEIGKQCHDVQDYKNAVFWLNKADATNDFDRAPSKNWRVTLVWLRIQVYLALRCEIEPFP